MAGSSLQLAAIFMTSIYKLLLPSLVVTLLVGCATPATQQSMSVSFQDLPSSPSALLKGQVSVGSVTGGKDTNPMWASQVDAPSFKGALDKSVAVVGYKALDASTAKYRIDAHLNELSQPLFDGSIIWMGRGERHFPQALTPATDFATTSLPALGPPAGSFENIFNPDHQTYDYVPVWQAVQHLTQVRAYLAANPTAAV